MSVGENEVPQILRVPAQRSQGLENHGLVTGIPGIDQGKLAVVALQQHAVGPAERQEPSSLDDLLHQYPLPLGSPDCRSGRKKMTRNAFLHRNHNLHIATLQAIGYGCGERRRPARRPASPAWSAPIVASVMTSAKTRQRNARGEGGRLRAEITEAAIRLIDQGTDPLTLRAIARQARIAGPSIYDHFPDLESIQAEVIRSCYEDLIGRILQAHGGVADPVDRLDATCLAYARYGADFPRRYALVFRGVRDQEEKLAVGGKGAAALQTLVDGIAACKQAGRSASADPYDDAIAVWAAIHGLTTLRSSRPGFARLHRDELMRTAVHRLACITSPPPPGQEK